MIFRTQMCQFRALSWPCRPRGPAASSISAPPAEAPGFEAGDFDIQVEDHRLVLRASRKSESKEKGVEKTEERECYQSITLPCDVATDKVEAAYRNGVLKVTMPKSPEAKGRKITVQGG